MINIKPKDQSSIQWNPISYTLQLKGDNPKMKFYKMPKFTNSKIYVTNNLRFNTTCRWNST